MGDMAEINTFIQEYSAFVTFSGLNVVVQSLSHVQLIATPWTAAPQASLSITNSKDSQTNMRMFRGHPNSYSVLK